MLTSQMFGQKKTTMQAIANSRVILSFSLMSQLSIHNFASKTNKEE
ncbi:hypothetical protein NIES4074_56060 [Cylindrospermum sp. NIES-4074]|nr:hypothetical protein NIES4074_56060 [Cylindrospermum sp. NIES-4074]